MADDRKPGAPVGGARLHALGILVVGYWRIDRFA
jgi:hypothetical protein